MLLYKIEKLKTLRPLDINGQQIAFVKKYNNLGIALDSQLNLEPFFKAIEKKVNNKIYFLRKIKRFTSFDIAVQIYKQTILPILDYGGFF